MSKLTAFRRGQLDGRAAAESSQRWWLVRVRGGGGIQQFGDRGRGLASGSGDGNSRLLLLLLMRMMVLVVGTHLGGGGDIAQLLDVQHKTILVLGDDNVIALQQAIVQLEFLGCAFRLFALVLLGGGCRGE